MRMLRWTLRVAALVVAATTASPAVAATTPGAGSRAYATTDGQTIAISFAPGYTPDATVAQSYADFLGSLPHGTELSKLRILITTPDDVRKRCGGRDGTLACYTSSNSTMTVPGQPANAFGVATNYIIAHEYGHHIATNRSNPPFDSRDYGPKYWASHEMVCNHVIEKRLFPGNEGANYLRNPGEAWADTYAHLAFPDVRWQYSSLLKPDATAYELARKDVLTPWTKPATKTFKGRFTPTTANARRFEFKLNLDGAMTVRLRGPKGTDYNLALLSGGKVEERTRTAGSRDRISYPDGACRQRPAETITVSVTRATGSGPFTLNVTYAV